jgi:hypothetical protein
MAVVPAGTSTVFASPLGWMYVTLGTTNAPRARPEPLKYAYAFELPEP